MEGHLRERRKKRSDYNQEYRMPYDTEREDNDEYSGELRVLSDIRLPEYLSRIVDAKEKAYNQFRDDFIAKLKSNIESYDRPEGGIPQLLRHDHGSAPDGHGRMEHRLAEL